MKNKIIAYKAVFGISMLITLMLELPFVPFMDNDYMQHVDILGITENVPVWTSLWVNSTSWLIYVFMLFVLFSKIQRIKMKYLKVAIISIFGVVIVMLMMATLVSLLHTYTNLFPSNESSSFAPNLVIILAYFFVAILVFTTSQVITLVEKRQQMALQYEILKAENIYTKYEALKNQVDPHFLFNSMSVLDSLIDYDIDKSHKFIQRFSASYRYILQNKDTVTLHGELQFIDDYFELMQFRYGDNLKLIKEIDEKYENYNIISLGLQILVENAIKHNVISDKNPLTIFISTTLNNEVLITNNLQLRNENSSGEGIGLLNLADRYRLKWGKEITIKIDNNQFCVTIPIIKP